MAGGQEFRGLLPEWMHDYEDWPVRTDRAEIEEVTCETCPNRTVARDGFCPTCRRFIREEDQASRDLTG